jgi:hypothetical protein
MRPLVDRYKSVFSVVVCITFLVALAWSLHRAWTHTEADFPSYYTAAHLVLKRQPLRAFYNMAEFQQQMDSFVVPSRLGGYIPQTPLTMLPFLPFAKFEIGTAKQLWLIADLIFLSGTVWLLTQITSLGAPGVIGLLLLGFGSLHTNLLLGQYYVLLLFLLTSAIYLLHKKLEFRAGLILGFICGLKLITAPFLLYFVAKRQPKAIAGMCFALGLGVLVAVPLFGVSDLIYYLERIFPRSVAGQTLDPFHPANGTLTTLLRRLLIHEPELNPRPLLNFPPLFFFLRPFFGLSLLWIAVLVFARTKSLSLGYAGMLATSILISPNTASYTFLLLLLPTALLLDDAGVRYKIPVLVCYLLLAVPTNPSWSWLFPKVWLLIAMFSLALIHSGSFPRRRTMMAGIAAAMVVSLCWAGFETKAYGREANQRWRHAVVERGAIYSSSPIPVQGGIVYQSISKGRYILRLHSPDKTRDFEFEGNSFHPSLLPGRKMIRFESVRAGTTHSMLLDPGTGAFEFLSRAEPVRASDVSRSPNGRWIVCERNSWGGTQIILMDRTGHLPPIQVTEGPCNSFSPAWDGDSQGIVFASDCGRGIGLPALYRAALDAMLALAPQ